MLAARVSWELLLASSMANVRTVGAKCISDNGQQYTDGSKEGWKAAATTGALAAPPILALLPTARKKKCTYHLGNSDHQVDVDEHPDAPDQE